MVSKCLYKCTQFSRLAISCVDSPNNYKKCMKVNFFSLFQTLMNAPVALEDAVRFARTFWAPSDVSASLDTSWPVMEEAALTLMNVPPTETTVRRCAEAMLVASHATAILGSG